MDKASSKPTKGATATAGTKPASTPTPAVNNDKETIDLSQLTPAQLAALQKQLKEKAKVTRGSSEQRFTIIDGALKEKNPKTKEFLHTTRDILDMLVAAKLVDTTVPGYDLNEIKKIQARKQFLEKKTDEKGNKVHAAGTFGYKKSEGGFLGISTAKVTEFFTDKEKVSKLTPEQRDLILSALGA